MRLDPTGALTPVDHILDTRLSRFGEVQAVASITHDGHTYVVAGGNDRGLTLFELLPDGQLLHLHSLPGSVNARLDGIVALELAIVGDELQVYVASETDDGLDVLSVDLSGRGAAQVAGDEGETVNGSSAGDLLVGGDGDDTLGGGSGDDILG